MSRGPWDAEGPLLLGSSKRKPKGKKWLGPGFLNVRRKNVMVLFTDAIS